MAQSESKRLQPMWDEGLEEKGLATLEQIEDGEFDLVLDIDDIPEVSKAHEQATKKYLSAERTRVQTLIDGKKLPQAIALITATETGSTVLSDIDVIESIRRTLIETGDAKSYKLFAEAQAIMLKQTQNLTRLDTVDGSGTSAKAALAIKFGTGSGSTTVQVGVQVDSE